MLNLKKEEQQLRKNLELADAEYENLSQLMMEQVAKWRQYRRITSTSREQFDKEHPAKVFDADVITARDNYIHCKELLTMNLQKQNDLLLQSLGKKRSHLIDTLTDTDDKENFIQNTGRLRGASLK